MITIKQNQVEFQIVGNNAYNLPNRIYEEAQYTVWIGNKARFVTGSQLIEFIESTMQTIHYSKTDEEILANKIEKTCKLKTKW